MSDDSTEQRVTLYDLVGGDQWFIDVIDRFYDGIEGDPLLRPMYPDDLTESRRSMTLFLIQYWGGHGTYSQERGHPRLRMRHMPFAVTAEAREAWLGHMHAAVKAGGLDPDVEEQVLAYFDNAATHLINA